MNIKVKNLQSRTTEVWDNYYTSIENGPVGNLYPNENLVRIVSTIRNGINLNNKEYFNLQGKENTNRVNFKGNALELGFGHVSNLIMMKEKGFTPYGLEVSRESVKRGKKRLKILNIKNISLNTWVPNKIPFPKNYFSFIYGLQCIYYCLDFKGILNEIFRVLKPQGYFYFSFFSNKHHYYKYINKIKIGKLFDIVEWSSNHPSIKIRNALLIKVKNRESLNKLFYKASEKRIFTEETDFSPIFNSWWHIYGKK